MGNIFKPKRSNVPSSIPTTSNLSDGELAVNSFDKKIFIRDGSTIVELSGTQGVQGLQGLQGRQGLQGLQGNQGTQGLQGTQGRQGAQGLDGAFAGQGVQGLQGLQGTAGFVGSDGPQGTQGLQGSQGIDGAFAGQGVQGLQGNEGSQGTQGLQGTLGRQGLQGIDGAFAGQGLQGLQGTQGTQGRQGAQGLDGAFAGQGVQGLQGTGGFVGSQGTQGIQGRDGAFAGQGVQGLQGRQGLQGSQGIDGAFAGQGVQGLQGRNGTQGANGTQGLDGAFAGQGLQGLQGVQGRQGLQGSQGLDGAFAGQGLQGLQGVQGRQGLQGSQGLDGAFAGQGVQGLQGHQGTQGRQGAQGLQGNQGVQGPQSAQGTQGLQGNQGVSGYVGADGPQGTQGLQGLQGLDGAFAGQGVQGVQGTQGLQATQGTQGVQGLQGLQGTQGVQGSSGILVVDDTTTNATRYLVFEDQTSGISDTDYVSSAKLVYNPSTGNVGIGTTKPTSDKLYVGGDVNVEGTIRGSSSFTLPKGKGIKWNNPAINQEVTVISDESLYLTGISTFADGPVLIGSATSTGTESQRLQVTGGTYISGNLGIGTTNPASKLHVEGTIIISGQNRTLDFMQDALDVDRVSGIRFYEGLDLVNEPRMFIDYNADSSLPSSGQLEFKGFNTTTNTLDIITTINRAGSVGIGTSRPVEKLHVLGNVYIGSSTVTATSSPVKIDTGNTYSNGTTRDKCKIYLYNSGTAQYGFGIGQNGDIQYHSNSIHDFYISNTLVSRINSIGVGIGTTNPTQRLSVVGAASSNTFVDVDTSTSGNVSGVSFLDAKTTKWSIANRPFDGNNLYFSASPADRNGSTIASNAKLTITQSGNLGIGTTNPLSEFHVIGNGRFTGVVTATTLDSSNATITNLTATNTSYSGIATFTNGPVLIGGGSSTGTASQRLQVTGGAYVSGAVGLGTTNPTQELHVQGDVRITGGFYDSNNIVGTAGSVLTSTGAGVSWSPPGSGAGLASRTIVSGVTTVLAANGIGNTDISGYKTYGLLKVGISTAAWVRLYTDSTSRTSDASRSIEVDPDSGSGVLAEFVTTGISTIKVTPFTMGFNDDNPATSVIYASVKNLSSISTSITVDLTILKLEE